MRRITPRLRLAMAVLLLVGLTPWIVQAAAIDALNVLVLRATRPFGTNWLEAEPRRTVLWSANRHAATIELANPRAYEPSPITSAVVQALGSQVAAARRDRALSMFWLLSGDWSAATSAFAAAEISRSTESTNELANAYGYQILQGLTALRNGDAEPAVVHLQRAAWLGGDRSAGDGVYQALYRALSDRYQYLAAVTGEWRFRYLRARYLDDARDPRAIELLEQIRREDTPDAGRDQAVDARIRLAQHALATGSVADARALLSDALAYGIPSGTAAVDELLLLRQLGFSEEAREVAIELERRGPRNYIGAWRNGEWVVRPIQLSPEWELVGYDLLSQSLDDGAEIPAVLYWRGPRGLTLDRRTLVNLAPNGGFEWGSALSMDAEPPSGTGYGYQAGVYGEPVSNDRIVQVGRAGSETHALLLDNANGSTRSGVLSVGSMAVQRSGWYLQAAWRRDEARGLVGRSCAPDEGEGGTYYIADSERADDWRYYATVAHPLDGERAADLCQVFIANLDSSGQAWFDEVLVTPISLPGPGAIDVE